LTDQFSIGVNAKYINENIYHNSATGFALDVGALFDTHLNGLMLGMCISNYGTKMQMEGQDFQMQHDAYPSINGNNGNINARFLTDRFDLPLMFRVGLSMDVLKGLGDSNLLLSVDALHPSDDVESVNTGVEYVFSNMIFLRGGYKGCFAKDSEEGFNFGGGLRYTLDGALTFHFDYSYTDFGIFSAVHTFSLGLEM
jgi:opacity protein-like surface antigen